MTQKERLIELLEPFAEDGFDYYSKEDVADSLLEDGVIVPLCKCGNTVYQTDGIRIYELEVIDIYLHENNTYYGTFNIDFDDTAIGTSIFLTREEAEAALKERKKK